MLGTEKTSDGPNILPKKGEREEGRQNEKPANFIEGGKKDFQKKGKISKK